MFDKICERLNGDMMTKYSFTSLDSNPVLIGPKDYFVILNDYCALPRVITRFLEKAKKKAQQAGMVAVMEELELNLTEERGQDPRAVPAGIPHYEMLRRGLKKELDFVPSKEVRPATKKFIDCLDEIISSESPARVIGATYALESSATPELKVVRRLFEAIAQKLNKPLSPSSDKSLIWFIEIHTDVYEVDHESRLKNAIASCLPPDSYAEFQSGFYEVMALMETWWNKMAKIP